MCSYSEQLNVEYINVCVCVGVKMNTHSSDPDHIAVLFCFVHCFALTLPFGYETKVLIMTRLA